MLVQIRIFDFMSKKYLTDIDKDDLRDALGEDAGGVDWTQNMGSVVSELLLNGVQLPVGMEYSK